MLIKHHIGSFRYAPHYRGNRSLPDGERMSFLLRPITRLELVAQTQWMRSADDMAAWRQQALAQHLSDPEYGALIPQLPLGIQAGLRQFVEHVSEPLNVTIEGDDGTIQPLTDVAAIFLHMVGEDAEAMTQRLADNGGAFASAEEASTCGLVAELQYVLGQTAHLRGEELKNFVSLCAGSSCPESTATTVTAATGNAAPAAAGT